jgi:23S rRNA (cytosine1962-C5)-methyltransferase
MRLNISLICKTGRKPVFILDQAANRKLVREYVREGDDVLDLFCNEGGFALNAAYAKAQSVIAVDSSEHAIRCRMKMRN